MSGGTKNIVYNIKQCFFDIIFPKYCLFCGQEGTNWCSSCQAREALAWGNVCFKCHQIEVELNLCAQCRELYFFDGLLCAASYKDEGFSTLIQTCKYRFVKDLTLPLGLLVAKHLEKELLNSKAIFFSYFFQAVVMAVPLSKRRQNWRGFNQAEEIAKVVASYFKLSYDNNLKRLKHCQAQAKLVEAKRLTNITGSFSFTGTAPKKIILIDDVITTGATVNECAKILRASGAEEILVLAVAKG